MNVNKSNDGEEVEVYLKRRKISSRKTRRKREKQTQTRTARTFRNIDFHIKHNNAYKIKNEGNINAINNGNRKGHKNDANNQTHIFFFFFN